MPENLKKDITVLEVSYEVCNKVGGIYTVITSKVAKMLESVREYIAVGPYYYDKAAVYFEEEKPPPNFQKAFNALHKKFGMNCYYGKWTTPGGKPTAILIDPADFRDKLNDIKAELWEFARVDSLTTDWWYDEPLPWSYSAGLLIEELVNTGAVSGKAVAHFHEFLAGAGILYLKKNKVPVGTVFTAHATMLGRAVAGTGREDIYALISNGISGNAPPDQKAKEYNVYSKYSLERAAAEKADVFTTVSDVTGRECGYVLGRKPDVILYNGLDMTKFPDMEGLTSKHIAYRDHVKRFLEAYFSPYYPFDAENTIFFFISGRFEFRNKGLDMFLDSMGRLNKRIAREKSGKTIVLFIWVPCEVKGKRHDVADSLALFDDLREAIQEESRSMSMRILCAFSQRKPLKQSQLIDEKFLQQLKRTELRFRKKDQSPPISPFVVDPNEITGSLERNGLMNGKDDPVKVVYYPTYISSTDGIMGLDYYNAMMACHVGVFPSYYEPWGYTPLEAAALGCQSITTDLAGYGKFMKPMLKKGDYSIMVLPRENRSYEQGVADLERMLYGIYMMDKRQRGQFKIRAKQLSVLADWSSMIKNYMKAYDMALKK